MIEYPYNAPLLLDDPIFMLHGGDLGTSSAPQRQVAYLFAEMQMTYHLDSFLVPTIVTGTHYWKGHNPVSLEFGNLISIKGMTVASPDWSSSCSMNLDTDGCSAIRGNGKYGYVDVQALMSCGGCGNVVRNPYNIIIAYESGLQTGTSLAPPIMAGLVLAAQINLNEMDVSLSNEGTADVGIQSFVNQKYSEMRTKLGTSAFGNSALAQRIVRLVKRYRTKPSIGFH